ncbi:hypothetical protein F7734_05290 [Scytonema sp. UIC 10036]|nr:hypothetical protein [Scytonema sp. UIC 10036]MUG91912.1 hypothetical protein [Scytonema sp. UIC 10036]
MNQPKFFITPGYGEYMLNELHYSQAVKIGNRVETSGQVASLQFVVRNS